MEADLRPVGGATWTKLRPLDSLNARYGCSRCSFNSNACPWVKTHPSSPSLISFLAFLCQKGQALYLRCLVCRLKSALMPTERCLNNSIFEIRKKSKLWVSPSLPDLHGWRREGSGESCDMTKATGSGSLCSSLLSSFITSSFVSCNLPLGSVPVSLPRPPPQLSFSFPRHLQTAHLRICQRLTHPPEFLAHRPRANDQGWRSFACLTPPSGLWPLASLTSYLVWNQRKLSFLSWIKPMQPQYLKHMFNSPCFVLSA